MPKTQFQTKTIELTGREGQYSVQGQGEVTFPANVINASAAIQAWRLEYIPGGEDYNIEKIGVEISDVNYNSGNSPRVSFEVNMLLREITPKNDEIKGSITVLVIAYCE